MPLYCKVWCSNWIRWQRRSRWRQEARTFHIVRCMKLRFIEIVSAAHISACLLHLLNSSVDFDYVSYRYVSTKAEPGGRSLAGIAGSNPVGGTDVCVLWMLCVVHVEVSVKGWFLIQMSSTKDDMSNCVRSQNLNGEAAWVRAGPFLHRGNRKVCT